MNLRFSIYGTLLAIIVNNLSLSLSFAQPGPNAVPLIQSCYQIIEFDMGGDPIDLLKSNSYMFVPSGDAGSWPDYWEIQQFSGGIELPKESNYFGLLGDGFGQILAPGGVLVVDAAKFEDNEYIFNQRTFSFNANADVIIIRPWHWTANPPTLDPGNNLKEFHLKNADEVFDFNLGINGSCNTFENFYANIATSLQGFCAFVKPIAELSIRLPEPADWNSVISQNINLGQNICLYHSPTFCDECLIAWAPWYAPDPVPCKCVKFDLKITVEPCPNAPENCEDLEIVKEVEICCQCDVRANPPDTGVKE